VKETTRYDEHITDEVDFDVEQTTTINFDPSIELNNNVVFPWHVSGDDGRSFTASRLLGYRPYLRTFKKSSFDEDIEPNYFDS
jgi:hypothetical protein